MNKLLKKLFDNVINNEKETIEVNKQIDNRIHTILDQYKEELTEEELEKFSSHLYYVALVAEQEGFQLGMKYLFKIAISLLSDL